MNLTTRGTDPRYPADPVGGSFNGRTNDSDSFYLGSNPSPPATPLPAPGLPPNSGRSTKLRPRPRGFGGWLRRPRPRTRRCAAHASGSIEAAAGSVGTDLPCKANDRDAGTRCLISAAGNPFSPLMAHSNSFGLASRRNSRSVTSPSISMTGMHRLSGLAARVPGISGRET